MSKAETKAYQFWAKWMQENEYEYDNFPISEVLEAYHQSRLKDDGILEVLQDCLSTINYMDYIIGEIKDHQTYFNTTRNSMELAEEVIYKLKTNGS